MRVQYIETLPISNPSVGDRQAIGDLADQLTRGGSAGRPAVEAELFERVAYLYGLDAREQAFVQGNLGPSFVPALGEEE